MKNTLILLVLLTVLSSHASNKLPEYYDLRMNDAITSPRKQMWGTCWAFSSIASMESNLLTQQQFAIGPQLPVHLSEYHMDKYSGFTRNGDDSHVNNTWYSGQGSNYIGSNSDDRENALVVHLGGDFNVAASYLFHEGGAIERRHVPYLFGQTDPHALFGDRDDEGVIKDDKYLKYIPSSVEWLVSESEEVTRIRIKESIMNYGAVSSAQFMEDDPYSYADPNHEFHYYYGPNEKNHAINIIGWDDKVTIPPLKKGAWIVRDSDHRDFFDIHINYYYISYQDQYVGKDKKMGGVSFRGVGLSSFDEVKFHALHGWTSDFDQASKVRNRYLIERKSSAVAVSFVSPVPNQRSTFSIKNNLNEILCGPYEKVIENPGFYKFDIDDCLLDKQHVFVELALSSKKYAVDGTSWFEVLLGNDFPKEGEPVLVASKAKAGESFYYSNRKWNDLYKFNWPENKKLLNKSANFVLDLFLKYE